MQKITFDDYIAEIRRCITQQKDSVYGGILSHPSPAQLREWCLAMYDKGLSRADENTFERFFQPREGQRLRDAVKHFDLGKFKKTQNFIAKPENGNSTTSHPNLELIAVLVDARPRPFIEFLKKRGSDGGESPPFEGTDIGKEEDVVILEQQSPHNKTTPTGISAPADDTPKRKRIWLVSAAVILSIVVGIYLARYVIFTSSSCMQWKKDHYAIVDCQGTPIGCPAPIIPYNPNLVNFRQIAVCDTTIFFVGGKPVVWYCKQNSNLEFYNAPGYHPITQKPLQPITGYIIQKYQLFATNCK